MRDCKVSFADSGEVSLAEDGPISGADVGSDDLESESLSWPFADSFFFCLAFRPERRSLASFGAPVANRTRSGSTWNMSPGFSW